MARWSRAQYSGRYAPLDGQPNPMISASGVHLDDQEPLGPEHLHGPTRAVHLRWDALPKIDQQRLNRALRCGDSPDVSSPSSDPHAMTPHRLGTSCHATPPIEEPRDQAGPAVPSGRPDPRSPPDSMTRDAEVHWAGHHLKAGRSPVSLPSERTNWADSRHLGATMGVCDLPFDECRRRGTPVRPAH